MARTRSMSRKHNHEEEEASKRPKSCARWSELDHNLLDIVIMKLGFIEFLSFRGVCKSWRSLACENQNKFMASKPPMHMIISCRAFEKTCHLVDPSEGTRVKTILPHTAVAACVGFTCGYLIFFTRKTRDFWLVNPITRKELHFPDFPLDYSPGWLGSRAILVFSPSTSGLVFVVSYRDKILFFVAGKGTWSFVPHDNHISDLCAFKGKIYIRIFERGTPYVLGELRLCPQPKLKLLEIKSPPDSFGSRLASSDEKLYAYQSFKVPTSLHELDLLEMKGVKACAKTFEEYAFFYSDVDNAVVPVRQESLADPQSYARYAKYNDDDDDDDDDGEKTVFSAKMWYFPHQCMSVDVIE